MAQQTRRFGSSESFLTLESGRGELLHRYEARPDRKSVSARLKHALLTQICHIHSSRFGVQKESIIIFLRSGSWGTRWTAASPVLPLGLLHMRPFLWWIKELRLHPTIPATRQIRVSRSCFRPLLQWRDPAFLQSGVRMGAIHRRHMITMDASMTGWGAVFEGRLARGEWTGEFLSWHINCLELRAVFLALMHFLPFLGEHHIIVRTDNMAVVSHINRQGDSRSRTLYRLARRLLLWSQGKFLSLRAVHVPGILNLVADFLPRQKLRP